MSLTPPKNLSRHPYHLVDLSPWPLTSSLATLVTALGAVMYFHGYQMSGFILKFGFFSLLLIIFAWWRDVTRESTYEGHHTGVVQAGIRYGIILFISTEIIFFLAFFWAFFHNSVVPSVEVGSVWPPQGIFVFDPWEVPLTNTIILLLSGCLVTWAHHALTSDDRFDGISGLVWTVVLASIFTGFQAYEYSTAGFLLSDSVYGSAFYMATGFHGFHVIVGTLFLTVCASRLIAYHFTKQHHFGFEAAAWYWHFVDVVWLFLFVSVYWWGGL
nr:cytochrome c oxidase subunit III [Cavernulicola chilensis]